MKQLTLALLLGGLGLFATLNQSANAASHKQMTDVQSGSMPMAMMGQGLLIPNMDAVRGRQLFASKGCVVCHSINGVGGEDAPALDASSMPIPMNPFEFAAKMWRGAEAMIVLQREELGQPIDLSGQELADIIAFVHHVGEQQKFTEVDIPTHIKELMGHMEGEEQMEKKGGAHESDKPKD